MSPKIQPNKIKKLPNLFIGLSVSHYFKNLQMIFERSQICWETDFFFQNYHKSRNIVFCDNSILIEHLKKTMFYHEVSICCFKI